MIDTQQEHKVNDVRDLRHVYLERALNQIPRILSLQDRNPYSPTYGSFHRPYWLDKTSDFPDALGQFGVQSLAIVYAHDMPGNIYYRQPKMLHWTIAGLEYWARVQHADGSFDEFYPYERGWAGPTAFTCFAAMEAVKCLGDDLPPEPRERILAAIRKAAHFIAAGESEEDHLANHHAIACMAVWKAYELLGDPALKVGFERLWRGFLRYQQPEGWSIEYDGVDPGYLSATVSFLGKVYQTHPTAEMLDVLRSAVEFASYFVYPNGYYGGSMGSRQTLHFYPHGFEVLAGEIPLAGSVAQKMLEGLDAGGLVPPEIMPDRYLVYRVAEYLQAYLDARPRAADLPKLPYERTAFTEWFPGARIYARRGERSYLLVNLAKGGVIKLFNAETGALIYNDCGVLGKLEDGALVSSQWVDPRYEVSVSDEIVQVQGSLQKMPSTKTFTPLKMAMFRGVLTAVGWNGQAAHFIKGGIRKLLMLGTRPIPVRFRRQIRLDGDNLLVTDRLERTGSVSFESLMIGDEFAVRYVPQSRYFQAQELGISGLTLSHAQVGQFNSTGALTVVRQVTLDGGVARTEVGDRSLSLGEIQAIGA
ncbi:MAG: hypothetical protein ACKVVP_14975 [Chloroflexota bacterium]